MVERMRTKFEDEVVLDVPNDGCFVGEDIYIRYVGSSFSSQNKVGTNDKLTRRQNDK